MKKQVLAMLLFATSFSANATLITYTDEYDPNPDILMSPSANTHSYTHDINDDGFDSSVDTISSILLSIDVDDDGDYDYNRYGRRYSSYCHGWGYNYHCHYSSYSYLISQGQPEYLTVDVDGTVFGAYEVDYNPIGFNIDIADLQLDGLLDITLAVTSGDLYFRSSSLTVEVDRVESVPEPASIALMGIGLVGLGFARKKKLAA